MAYDYNARSCDYTIFDNVDHPFHSASLASVVTAAKCYLSIGKPVLLRVDYDAGTRRYHCYPVRSARNSEMPRSSSKPVPAACQLGLGAYETDGIVGAAGALVSSPLGIRAQERVRSTWPPDLCAAMTRSGALPCSTDSSIAVSMSNAFGPSPPLQRPTPGAAKSRTDCSALSSPPIRATTASK